MSFRDAIYRMRSKILGGGGRPQSSGAKGSRVTGMDVPKIKVQKRDLKTANDVTREQYLSAWDDVARDVKKQRKIMRTTNRRSSKEATAERVNRANVAGMRKSGSYAENFVDGAFNNIKGRRKDYVSVKPRVSKEGHEFLDRANNNKYQIEANKIKDNILKKIRYGK